MIINYKIFESKNQREKYKNWKIGDTVYCIDADFLQLQLQLGKNYIIEDINKNTVKCRIKVMSRSSLFGNKQDLLVWDADHFTKDIDHPVLRKLREKRFDL